MLFTRIFSESALTLDDEPTHFLLAAFRKKPRPCPEGPAQLWRMLLVWSSLASGNPAECLPAVSQFTLVCEPFSSREGLVGSQTSTFYLQQCSLFLLRGRSCRKCPVCSNLISFPLEETAQFLAHGRPPSDDLEFSGARGYFTGVRSGTVRCVCLLCHLLPAPFFYSLLAMVKCTKDKTAWLPFTYTHVGEFNWNAFS